MLILGIETSSAVSSIAFGERSGPIAALMVGRARGHAEFLMPAIRTLADQAGVSLGDVTCVATGLGPGMFTSMRVGIATAKTMAQVLEVPVIGIPSLDVIAFGVRHSPKLICACIDARREEVYAATYRQVPGGIQRVSDPQVWEATRLCDELAARKEDVLFVGDGARAHAAAFASLGEIASESTWTPAAGHLVELAVAKVELEDFRPFAQLEPLYVRKTDAEIKWEQRGVTIERPMRVKTAKRGAR
ncbi:MAG TPA: tRNA (adenosine(37)-N6)-threonylcarbamoyltransferase complex dimerization subunit type 1 TsaB [Actinomycetota bacterium]|nr:tRNA (adenosine(37)-N6)-threonylcarbamoyltransferase complex dimerization subunit type 1 TsaB [Actinomycetota bacterium]